jgi:Cytidylate kinase-like family
MGVPFSAALSTQAGDERERERGATRVTAAPPPRAGRRRGGDAGAPAPLPADVFSSEDFRRATEEVLLQQAASGRGVILGRGSVAVLREDPRALRVRVDGPVQRRIEKAMQLDHGLDRERADQALRQFDRTHAAYLQQFSTGSTWATRRSTTSRSTRPRPGSRPAWS